MSSLTGAMGTTPGVMAATHDGGARVDRIARYKEERRRQIAQQQLVNANSQQPNPASPRRYITRAKSAAPSSPANGDRSRVIPAAAGIGSGDVSSGSDSVTVRTTRASRLRAARLGTAGDAGSPAKKNGAPTTPDVKEKSTDILSYLDSSPRISRSEKDKSSKRKSNLNRSLNAEETPSPDSHDDNNAASRRRRRRILNPNDILTSLNESGVSSASPSTSTRVTPLPSPSTPSKSSVNHSSITTPTSTQLPRRSELSIHMENARRGVTASDSPKLRTPTRKHYVSSTRSKSDSEKKRSTTCSEPEEYFSSTDRVRKASERKVSSSTDVASKSKLDSSKSASKSLTDYSKRMDELTAFTRETLARVERLTTRCNQSPRREISDNSRKKLPTKSPEKVSKSNRLSSDVKTVFNNEKLSSITNSSNSTSSAPTNLGLNLEIDHQNYNGYHHHNVHDDNSKPSSILKKKSQDDIVNIPPPPLSVHVQAPVSILKRKSSQDESSASSSFATPPVTFSPTVIDPIRSKKPGILKKRCSLDESHVIRRRSYSPDVALVEGSSDYKPILKNQRRSSLEEIIRTHSPDTHPQGILKRKHSRGEDEFGERSLGSPEPQSILKRKSGTSSSGSSGNSPHVSIATAVILAAAGGAEIILESNETVKPILKKKSISDENPNMDSLNPEIPKPILKKKSSTETDDQDDRPIKTILKTSRKCSQDDNYSSRESNDYSIDSPRIYSVLKTRSNHNSGESSSECETVRPILKQSSSRENSPRPRLSFCETNNEDANLLEHNSSPQSPDSAKRRSKFVRRSNTVADADLSSIINLRRSFEGVQSANEDRDENEENVMPKRPISVFEMVMNFEKSNNTNISTGAIPKRSSLKGSRSSGRFRTQPITFDELEATQRLEPFPAHSLSTTEQQQQILTPSPPNLLQSSPLHSHRDQNSSGDLSHSLDLSSTLSSNNDSQLTTPSSVPNESADSGVASKMSFVNEDDEEGRRREDDEDDDDGEEEVQELCRSNSVSAKASLFKQLEAQMKAVAEEAKMVRLAKGGNKGIQRYRNRKQASTSENRFSTQPVTFDEVQEAVKANQRTTETPEEDISSSTADTVSNSNQTKPNIDSEEFDPSKLSLAERVKLFNKKITEERIPVAGGGPSTVTRKPRYARYKTQPVTNEEVETAQQKINPLVASLVKPPDADSLEGLSIRATKDKIHEHAAKMLTNEVRGILKSKSAISPVPTSSPSPEDEAPRKTILKTESETSNGHKTGSSEDEGVSTNEDTTSSTSENQPNKFKLKLETQLKDRKTKDDEKENANNRKSKTVADELKLKVDECVKELEVRNKVRRHLEEVQQMSSSEGTSDAESSGSREVKRINNDAVARRRQAAINRQKEKNGQLTKSKSQSSITHQTPSQQNRTPLVTRGVHLATSPVTESPPKSNDRTETYVRSGVRRSLTLPLRQEAHSSGGGDEMPGGGTTIADRLAELQNSGNNEWRKRLPKLNTANDELIQLNSIVTKNLYNESLSETVSLEKSPSILAARKDKLDAAAQQWKKRVEVNDAINFSVAGRMHQESKELPVPGFGGVVDKKKRTPKANRFKGRESVDNAKPAISTPVSPQKEAQIKFKRSVSAPGVGDEEIDSDTEQPVTKTEGRRVIVPRPDDETFTTFFESVVSKSQSHQSEHLEVTTEDLDSVTRQSGDFLVTKRTVRIQRKHAGTTKNPIKALAARTDIKEEYTEIITGVAEREKRRINIEKLAKHSSMAIEALAGLASKEDFTAIALKKGTANTNTSFLPYKDLMLLHIKGRRHVQTRLVEPIAASINKGDNYILITPTQVYNYVGLYSNIIEQARGAEIALHIQQKKDLGCKCNDVITIHEKKAKSTRSQLEAFWKLLGSTPDEEVTEAGHPDEDEIYESTIIDTNMVYELDAEELVPVESYWGAIPKIEMLVASKVFVFDFGSEMYIWSGKNAPIEQRKIAAKLAKELWEDGFNYSECSICPVNATVLLGIRKNQQVEKKSNSRPEWALLAKITQHGETILFREKFLDWPDFSRVIKVKNNNEKTVDGSIVVKPCDAKSMRESISNYPDFILEGSHLGRGRNYFDEETSRHFEITTLRITAWHILEYEYEQLPEASIGQFSNGDSYIIRWQYMLSVTGRELSGKPSKHSMLGRDRCAYFCWQGREAPLNEKGAAALLTVELDHERGPQVRVTQGNEPPAFLNLFEGSMAVHMGRRDSADHKSSKKLFMCRGETEDEVHLVEVTCSMRQLRSRGSFILVNSSTGTITIWHGVKSLKRTRNFATIAAKKIKENRPTEFGFNDNISLTIQEMDEGDESDDFKCNLGGGNRQLYFSLLKQSQNYENTPRMFHLSSISGGFKSNEIHSPHIIEDAICSYPFIQNDLYAASQPALFLVDNGYELWLWQGWWPEIDSDSDSDSDRSYSDQTGSGQHRWQAERRAAMQTALDYWNGPRDKGVPAYLVWAGLEPLEFTNLFPTWTDRDDIAEQNIKDGRKGGEILRVETELARLTQSTYPLVQLLQRPLPEGVDPTHLEDYLSSEDFITLLGIGKPEFQKLPIWKQTNMKKEKGLF